MQAVLKSLDLHPDPSTLGADAAAFSLHAERLTADPGETMALRMNRRLG